MRTRLTEIFRTKTRDEWVAIFEGTDACVTGIPDIEEAPKHPHNVSRGVFIEVEGVPQPAPAPRFSRSKPGIPTPAPEIGAHTSEILKRG